MGERPKVGVGVVIFKGDKVLMHRRRGAHGAGKWSFLGGHMEHGEEPHQTAMREAEEEARIAIKDCRLIGVTNDIMPEGKHYITLFVAAQWASGEPVAGDESTDLQWMDPTTMPSPLFPPVEKLIDGRIYPNQDVWNELLAQ
ncbi:MAG: NUDIX domain-containing protein, partial [Nanoarchaeota archaeon]